MYARSGDEDDVWREVTIKRKRAAWGSRARKKMKGRTQYPQPLEVVKEFSQETTLHGVRYISREGANICDRVVWSAAFLVCFVFAVFFVLTAWNKFVQSPIVTTVEDAYYPLYKLPFPAITVCPNSNVRRTVGEKLLISYLNTSLNEDNLNQTLWHLMRAMSFLRYPYYHQMEGDLKKVADIRRFDELNMTDFMLKVLPDSIDIFEQCYWQGREMNCSDIFDLQRYEGGFCYAFNSLTSEKAKECNDVDSSVIVNSKKEKDYACVLFHNAAAGTTTGLEVFFKPTNEADHLGLEKLDAKGIRVLLHGPDEFPQAGNGLFMLDKKIKIGTIKILPSVTESSSSLRGMSPTKRNCYFSDERSLDIYSSYSQESCLIECRLKYIIQMCNCQPYFFNDPNDNVSECTVSQLSCIVKHNRDLRFFSTPAGSRVVNSIHNDTPNNALNCSNCLPTCSSVNYDIDASFSEDSKPHNNADIGYLNIFYKEASGVKYLRAPAVDKMQLLVSFGGIAGLFLGVSLLTVIEILYYLARVCKSLYYHYYKEQRPKIKPRNIHTGTLLQVRVTSLSSTIHKKQNIKQDISNQFFWPHH